jgi:hypothetical protein
LSRRLAIIKHVQQLVSKQALIRVDPQSPGFYSHVFVLPKSSGSWQLVIDLKGLNAYIDAPHLKMSTVNVVLYTYVRETGHSNWIFMSRNFSDSIP